MCCSKKFRLKNVVAEAELGCICMFPGFNQSHTIAGGELHPLHQLTR